MFEETYRSARWQHAKQSSTSNNIPQQSPLIIHGELHVGIFVVNCCLKTGPTPLAYDHGVVEVILRPVYLAVLYNRRRYSMAGASRKLLKLRLSLPPRSERNHLGRDKTIDMVCPVLHHVSSLCQILSMIISGTHLVPLFMRQLPLYDILAETHLVKRS